MKGISVFCLIPLIEICTSTTDPEHLRLADIRDIPQNAWVNPGRGWIQLECVEPKHDCGFDCFQTCSKEGRCVSPLPLPPPDVIGPICHGGWRRCGRRCCPPRPVRPLPPRPRPPPPRSVRQRQRRFCPLDTKSCGDVCCRRIEECIADLYCAQPQNCPPPGLPCGSSCCAPWERCVAGVCGRLNSYCQYPRIVCGKECCEAWETCDFDRKICFRQRNSGPR